MKTLDEVIAELEDARVQVETGTGYWVDYRDNDDLKADALHYLKEYKAKEMFYNQSVDHIVQMMNEHEDRVSFYLAEMNRNPPLTWAELKQMEGKPVWIEYPEIGEAYWAIIGSWYDSDEMRLFRADYADTYYVNRELYEDGTRWQAYRKERNEDA